MLEHLRSEHAHRHLGVSEADFQRWAEKAGLSVKAARTFRAPGGDKGVTVIVWTADNLKSAKAGRSAA
jgi:ArsR family transcriptional regulator